jgi:hypothetical protein
MIALLSIEVIKRDGWKLRSIKILLKSFFPDLCYLMITLPSLLSCCISPS